MYRNCKVKKCCIDRQYTTCAECNEFVNLKECGKLYNLISRFFGFVFRTNRIGNLNRVREVGIDQFQREVLAESDH